MTTVDIYARVSRKGDRDQRSTAGQAQVCRAILDQRGLEMGKVFIDDGRSAWNPTVRRPAWEELMTRLEDGTSKGVIVFDLERFARQPKDGERLITAAQHGLVVLDSDGIFDLTSASGKKSFRDAMAAAAYYSDRLSDRVRRGKAHKAQNGQVDKRRSFGFEPDGITHRPDEAAIIRECAERLLRGESQHALVADLQARGIPTTSGAPWGRTAFRAVMTRPRNAGLIAHNGTVVARLPGEPILDEDTYQRVLALYAARRPGRPPSGKYLLTGLAACGREDCGHALGGRPTSYDTQQYWCRACHHTFISTRQLDTWAIDWAIRELSDPTVTAELAETTREQEERRTALLKDIGEAETLARAVADRLGRGEISLDRYDAVTRPLDRRLADLRRTLEELEAEAAQPATGRTLREFDPEGYAQMGWLQVATEGSPADRRAMVTQALAGRRIVIGSGTRGRADQDRITIR